MTKFAAIAIQAQIGAETEEELARVGGILKALFVGGVKELRIGGLFEIDHPGPKMPRTLRKPVTKALPPPQKKPRAERAATDVAQDELEKVYPGTLRPADIIPKMIAANFSEGSAYASLYALEKKGVARRYVNGMYKLKHAPRPAASKEKTDEPVTKERVIDVVRRVVSSAKSQGASHVSRAELHERVEAVRPGTVVQSLDAAMQVLMKEGVVARVSAGAYSIS